MAGKLTLDLQNANLEDSEESETGSEYSEDSEEETRLPLKSPVAALVLGDANNKSYHEESDIHADLNVTLVFPDGVEKPLICKSGETVINLKKKLFDEFEIPFSCKIFYNDKLMLDPLSLNDFPEIVAAGNQKERILLKIQL